LQPPRRPPPFPYTTLFRSLKASIVSSPKRPAPTITPVTGHFYEDALGANVAFSQGPRFSRSRYHVTRFRRQLYEDSRRHSTPRRSEERRVGKECRSGRAAE